MKFTLRNFFFLTIIFLAASIATFAQTTPQKPADNKPATNDKPATPPATDTKTTTTAPAANIEGKWDMDIDFNGQMLKATLTITKEKDEYTGMVTSDNGEGKITKASFKDNNLDATVAFSLNGQPLQIQIKSAVDKEGKMKGTLMPEGVGEFPFTATKAK